MTALRLISLPTHSMLELTGGLAMIAAPFVFGFSAAGLVIAVVLGALIAGLALATAVPEESTVPIATHFTFDRGIAIGLLTAAIALGVSGDTGAALFFALAALAQSALNLITRYSLRA